MLENNKNTLNRSNVVGICVTKCFPISSILSSRNSAKAFKISRSPFRVVIPLGLEPMTPFLKSLNKYAIL